MCPSPTLPSTSRYAHSYSRPLLVALLTCGSQLWLVATSTYLAGIAIVKLSLLFFYRRIITVNIRHFSIAWWATTILLVAYTVPYIILNVCFCRPVQAAWDITLLSNAKCLDLELLFITHGGLNGLTDLLILLLPLPILWGLCLTTKRKILVSLVFGVGVL